MKKKSFKFSQLNIPNGVKIEKKKSGLLFSGILGSTWLDCTKIDPTGLSTIQILESQRTLFISSRSNSLKGLLQNKIRGVSIGFEKTLTIVGVGYRALLEQNQRVLNLKVGFSHNLKYQVPQGVRAFLLGPLQLILFGVDNNQLSQVATRIRGSRPPERYKGKGIRFTTEKVSLFQGKRK